MISEKLLIEAFIEKWNKEHPIYEDTSGCMTYPEIIDYIKNFSLHHNISYDDIIESKEYKNG